MKKLVLTLILSLSISTLLHAQWNNYPTGTIYTITDKVSIGNVTPVAGLSTEAGENAAIAPLTAVPNGSAWIGGSGTNGGLSMGQFSGTYGYIQSRNKGTGSGAYKLALNPLGGFVGIGTAAPASALHVLDANATLLTLERFNSAGGMNIQYKNNTYTIYAGLDINGGFSVGTTANFSNSSVLTATATGNVGVGTFTPISSFQVGSGSAEVSLGDANSADLHYGTGYIGFNAARRSSGTWTIAGNTVSNGGGVIYSDVFGNIYMAPIASNGPDIQTLSDLDIKSRIAFSVTPTGVVRAKQIKVETANWPDYVFKKDYQLPSLAEVKTYIDQNQHLPEMPSEQEIAKEGLNLGEMNKLLVKKVEELTLYLIEKDREVSKQNDRINDLENKYKALIGLLREKSK